MRQEELDEMVLGEIARIKGSKRRRDWPCVEAACSPLAESLAFCLRHNGTPSEGEYCEKLRTYFINVLGADILQHSQFVSKFPVGQCAEQHAANEVIVNNPSSQIDDLVFSHAFNVRIEIHKPYCQNCLRAFPQLQD